jgi:uncharacterized membrane protein YcaP (DUF421 family)
MVTVFVVLMVIFAAIRFLGRREVHRMDSISPSLD